MRLQTLLKHTSRSLYLSAQMLPASIRPAFGLAYLLCRYADTIADTLLLPRERRLYWIEQFPHWVHKRDASQQMQLIYEISGSAENHYEHALLSHLTDCFRAFAAIPAAQQALIEEVVTSVCLGMEIDLQTFPNKMYAAPVAFKTAQDLTQYCRLMGGKPGLFWSKLIWQTGEVQLPQELFFQLGEQIGDALQIVNILRDAPKDLQLGRCYFPNEELKAAGLSANDLLISQNSARFEPIKQKWIAWGKQNLQQAFAYFYAIPKTSVRVRAAVAWPILWTADTLLKLSQTSTLLDPSRRVKIPRSTIYATLAATPAILVSNRLFDNWLQHKLEKLP